jgi:hypothetical protein
LEFFACFCLFRITLQYLICMFWDEKKSSIE